MDLEIKLIITAVQKHGCAKIRVIGDSMRPLIKSGQEILIEKVSYEDIRVGDVVAYQNRQHNLVVHQVLFKADKYLVTWGVNNNFVDPPVPMKSILGRVPMNDHWRRINLMYLSISKQIADRFGSQKIKHLFLKGAPWQESLFGYPLNLPVSDVDILVDRTRYIEAKKILSDLRFKNKKIPWVNGKFYRGDNPAVSEITFGKNIDGILFDVDLHLNAVRSSLTVKFPLDFLSDGSAIRFTRDLFKHETKRLGWAIANPTWQLIYLLLNFVFHHAGRGVKSYAQIASLIESQKIDWKEFWKVCNRYGVARVVYLPLVWLNRLFKVKVRLDHHWANSASLVMAKLVINRWNVVRPLRTNGWFSSQINLFFIFLLRLSFR